MGILSSIKQAISGNKPDPQPERPKSMPDSFYIDTVELERHQKEQFFRTSPYSPIEDRLNFGGLTYFPVDPQLRLTLPLQRADAPEPLTIQTNTGEARDFLRLGVVEFEIDGEAAQLAIYQGVEQEELFVPFRDATSGNETYGAGRYLEPESLPDGRILLDFNAAYNPFCAYSENYSCPLPPFENHLRVAIYAGEKRYK
jgi:hypothetical protein